MSFPIYTLASSLVPQTVIKKMLGSPPGKKHSGINFNFFSRSTSNNHRSNIIKSRSKSSKHIYIYMSILDLSYIIFPEGIIH